MVLASVWFSRGYNTLRGLAVGGSMFFWWKDENKDSEGIERIKRDQSVEGDAVYPKLLEVCTFLDCGGEKRIIYVNLLREGVPHHF